MSGDLYFNNVQGNLQDYIYVTDCSGIQLGTGDYEIEWEQCMDFAQSQSVCRIWTLGNYERPYDF